MSVIRRRVWAQRGRPGGVLRTKHERGWEREQRWDPDKDWLERREEGQETLFHKVTERRMSRSSPSSVAATGHLRLLST